MGDLANEGASHKSSERILHLALRLADSSTSLYLLHKRRVSARLVRMLRPEAIELYHEPQIIAAPFEGPTVITVHDCSVQRYPQFHPAARVRYFENEFERSLERADRIVVPSNIVRSELIKRHGVSPAKVRTIYHGPSPDCSPVSKSELQQHRLVHNRFVLCIGTLEPRKNLSTLLDAWERLPDTLRRDCPLVLCGARGWRDDRLARRITSLARFSDVRYLGYVPDALALRLLRSCRLFVYPSIYEGFGLPVLAAMRQGAPAIVGYGTAMAEYGGSAVRAVDVHSAEAIAAAVEDLLTDPAGRDALRVRATEKARGFDWRKSAREHVAVYREALD